MARKPHHNTDQLTFSLTISKEELLSLEGGSQQELSDFERGLRNCMRSVLDDAAKRDKDPIDRYAIAAEMSRKLGREITKSRIDEWVALSTVTRRIHVDALMAFCAVTGDQRPIHYFCEANGLRALEPKMALCAEWGASEVVRRNLANKQKTLGIELEDPEIINALTQRLLGGK